MRILVPVDGSEAAARAAAFAAQLAKRFEGSVLLLHVYDEPTSAALTAASTPGLGPETPRTQAAQRGIREAIDAMGAFEPEASLVEHGDPAERILAIAAAQDVDHIVMGTRGRTPVKSLMLGSVSEHIARNATCPVTVLR